MSALPEFLIGPFVARATDRVSTWTYARLADGTHMWVMDTYSRHTDPVEYRSREEALRDSAMLEAAGRLAMEEDASPFLEVRRDP